MTATALSNLVNVRYYAPGDVYNYNTDNRPLVDLQTNIVSLATLVDGLQAGNVFYFEDSSTSVNSLVATTALMPSGGPYTAGQLVTLRVNNTNTGAVTLTINSGAAYAVHGMVGALQGGELVAGKHYLLSWENSDSVWELVGAGKGSLQVAAAVQSAQAVNLGQLQDDTVSASLTGLAVSGPSTLGTTTVPAAAAASNPVTLSQLFVGNRQMAFTMDGTYTVPAGVTSIWVSGVGGGGGGGGANTLGALTQGAGGGGGYSGAQVIKAPFSVNPGDVITVTIGMGGSGGAGAGILGTGANGMMGGNTVIANTTAGTTLLTLAGGGMGMGAYIYNTNYVFGGMGFMMGSTMVGVDASNGSSGQASMGGTGQGNAFGIPGGQGGAGEVLTIGTLGTGGGGGGGGDGSNGGNGGSGGDGFVILEW